MLSRASSTFPRRRSFCCHYGHSEGDRCTSVPSIFDASYQDHQSRAGRRLHRLAAAFLQPPGHSFGRREEFWERLAQRLDPSRPLVALEFGVGWVYATNWWPCRLRAHDVAWYGFDRFTVRAWDEWEQGAFDAGGKPPAIDDERVRWHVGDVEDTLGAVDLVAARDAQWLVLFHLDIYEPTAFAWEMISPHLRPGDVIYLDDAMDRDERRVLDEMMLPATSCEPVGTTALALGLVVTRPVR